MTPRRPPGGLVAELEQRVAPITPAGLRLVPVPEPLAPLFPGRGLQQGWSVGVAGPGGWSLALALLGAALRGDGWAAGVGVEELGLVAADELGVPLSRLLLVESPGTARQAAVLAALVEVVDVVVLGPLGPLPARDARRLSARAREQGVILLHLDGGRSWPQALDATLTVEPGPWIGVGQGHGHLRARPVGVTAVGRRSLARPRRVEVLLPGPDGGLAVPAEGGITDDGVADGVGTTTRIADGVEVAARVPSALAGPAR